MLITQTMISLLILIILYETNISDETVYTAVNSKDSFNLFKQKYNKTYKNETIESKHFNNYIANLNTLEKLNDGINKTYDINENADLDPTEMEQKYAIDVKPFTNVLANGKSTVLLQIEAAKKPDIVVPSKLYNLDEAYDLFEDYLVKYKKKKFKDDFERLKHYYRFVKTLVRLNREILAGNKAVLDDKADVPEEPLEYMF